MNGELPGIEKLIDKFLRRLIAPETVWINLGKILTS